MVSDNTLDGIVAMPVGNNPEVETKLILPDLTWAHDHKWNDLLLMEITKMKDKLSSGIADNLRAALICFRYGSYVLENEARKLMAHTTQIQGRGTQIQGRGTQIQGRGTQIQGRGTQIQGRGTQIRGRGTQIQGRGTQIQGHFSPTHYHHLASIF